MTHTLPNLRAPQGRAALLVLDHSGLVAGCRKLRAQMAAARIIPTHVVGIANAGVHVAKAFAKVATPNPVLLTVRSQRPTSPIKDRVATANIVSRLPEWSIQILRRIELRLLTHRLSANREVAMAPEDAEALRQVPPGSTVVILDDCIDTGATLRSALEFIRASVGESCRVYTACLAATIEKPLVRPDFVLQEELVIGIRGPWSRDARA